jgi:ADP-glucose pyrophosphorylase
MASEYRRAIGTETWHFCSDCSLWPTQDFVSTTDLPNSLICNECAVKDHHDECE